MRSTAAALACLLTLAPAASADEVDEPDVARCVERSVPEPDSVRQATISHTDRAGSKTRTGIMLYGRRGDGGGRELLIRFVRPESLTGSAVLMRERNGGNEVYFASAKLEKTKRFKSLSHAASLVGTSFSYEDLQLLEGFRLGPWERKEDDDEFGRPVYVVEIRPEASAYERIVSRIDKETCLPLSVRFVEPGNFVSKELSVSGSSLRQVGSSWVPQSVMMRSRRDRSTTRISFDRAEQQPVPDRMFDPDRLLETAASTELPALGLEAR